MTAELWTVAVADYYADQRQSVSHSDLEVFRESPRLYEGQFLTGEWPAEETDDMVFGRVFHGLCLEDVIGAVLIPREVLSASGQKRGKAWDEFEAAHAGKVLMTAAQLEQMAWMRGAIETHEQANRLLFELPGKNECTIRWTDPETGLVCRCRIDRLLERVIVDLKTTADASPKRFAGTVYEYGYHRQAAFYRRAVFALTGEWLPFAFIAVEKTPPFEVAVFDLTDEFLRLGEEETAEDLRQFARCRESGVWQREFYGEIETIDVPRWARFEKEWSR